jgi:ribosomal protein S21
VFVTARPSEPFEELFRRFKRGMETSGILREYRRKQRFIPNHERRRAKLQAARRRQKKAAWLASGSEPAAESSCRREDSVPGRARAFRYYPPVHGGMTHWCRETLPTGVSMHYALVPGCTTG